jgi:hypothetical protein
VRGNLLERFHRHRFACLFAALLATLGARPVLEILGSSHDPFDLFVAASLLMAALGLAGEPGMRWLVGFAALSVVALGLGWALAADTMQEVGAVLWPAGFLLAIVASIRHALGAGRVDGERIFAALDAYLLAGLLFAGAFRLLETLHPGSFGGAAGESGLDVRQAIYLSFVTIVSLGYGDLVPKSEAARGLAIVEAVSGQMYLAVLVARLVSLYSRQTDPD